MGFVKYFKSKANEIEAQGFKVIPTSSDVLIKNHNGCCLSIYKPRGIAKEETFLYLDGPCGSGYGTESFIREWRDLDKLYSYIMKICLPKMKYFTNPILSSSLSQAAKAASIIASAAGAAESFEKIYTAPLFRPR